MTTEPTPIDSRQLAEQVVPILTNSVLGFDVDGVLAPIVEHADNAVLQAGVWDSLTALAHRSEIAIISGRSLESLERLFKFDSSVHVIGSHGLEWRGHGDLHLDEREQRTLQQLQTLAYAAVDAIGDGAWVEHKVASVVVHTRQANSSKTTPAIRALNRLANMIDGATVKSGSEVVELFALDADKGTAMHLLAKNLGRQPGFFIGDDITDEDAFSVVDDAGGITVRIGPGQTTARYRLANATIAAQFLTALTALA